MQLSPQLIEFLKLPKITLLAVIFFSLTLVAAPIAPAIANLLMGLTLITIVFTAQFRENFLPIFRSKIGLLIIAWLVCLVFYTIVTQSDSQSALRGLSSWRKFLLFPLGLILFSGNLKLQKFGIAIIACVFTLLALISFAFFLIPALSIKTPYPGVLMANYVAQALMFGVATLILMVYLYLNYARLRWPAILAIVSIILLLLGNIFFISSGRSGYAAVFIMFVVAWLMLTVRVKWSLKLGGLALIVALLTLIAFNSPRVKERIDLAISEVKSGLVTPEYTSLGLRITFYKETLKMAPQYLILGAGTGGFLHAYEQQVVNYTYPASEVTPDPHNQYLRILIEQGIVGLFVFLLLLFKILISPTTAKYTQVLGVSVLVAWMITSLFNSHFASFNEGVFIWGWLGLCFAFPYITKRSNI